MPRKPKPPPKTRAEMPSMSRDEWALAFGRKVDALRPDMGRKYLATIVATLWPKHQVDDPERIAIAWVAEREAS